MEKCKIVADVEWEIKLQKTVWRQIARKKKEKSSK